MRPLFWKELRQNLKWAIGVMVVMSLATVYVAWLASDPWNAHGMLGWAAYLSPWDRFQQVSVLVCPLAGLVLGVLHVAAEKRRDLWAFLVHRPVSRTTIFAAKASAGLLLYAVAAGIPVAAGLIWLATPGHAPVPFYPPMALPGIADVLTGAIYYLAGLLISMREARWYGSRVLALGVAVVCSLVVVLAAQFWMALVAIAVSAGLLGVAAWGSFLGGGLSGPQPLPARLALGASLLTGLAVVVGLGGVILSVTAGSRIAMTSYQLTLAGEVVRVVRDGWGRVVEITDLAGARREDLEAHAREADYSHDPFVRPIDAYVPDQAHPAAWLQPTYRRTSKFYRDIGSDQSTQWFYSFPERLVLAFDREHKVLIGRLGPDGFRAAGAAPGRRFSPEIILVSWTGTTLAFADIVYKLDIRGRTVQELFAPVDERVLALALDPRSVNGAFVVVTDRAVRYLSPEGDPLFAAGIEYDLSRYRHLRLGASDEPDRFFVWYEPYALEPAAPETPGHVIAYGPDGAELARYELPPISPLESRSSWHAAIAGLVMPLAFVVAGSIVLLVQGEPLFGPFGIPAVIAALVPLTAIACALLTFSLARRYAFGAAQRWAWTVFNLLIGPAGLGLLWALRDWPGRVPCAGCGRLRVVSRERCEHCGSEFPSPALDGTEIFE